MMDPYKYINSFVKFGNRGGYKPGLERMEALLDAPGNPRDKLNVIHVAGSNGKGSTIAFLKSIYREAGYKVGVYTSPHLLSLNERLEVDGKKISTKELGLLVNEIKPIIDKIQITEVGKPSFFELLTALAFLYFAREKVDILLLEVGLGGRLDATNVVKKPLASVITGISLEHTAILGDTLAKIAREKAGIIKEGSPVITAVSKKEALEVIKEIAGERNAALSVIDEIYDFKMKESTLEGQLFSLFYKQASIRGTFLNSCSEKENNSIVYNSNSEGNICDLSGEYKISLLGEYQIRNAILALEVVKRLMAKFSVEKNILKNALNRAYIPGRLELLQEEPYILLDGAHNPDGMEKLVSFLLSKIDNDRKSKMKMENSEKEKSTKKIYMLFAVLKDKDLKNILRELKKIKNLQLIISRNSDQRALETSIIKKEADLLGIPNKVLEAIAEAYEYLKKIVDKDDLIIVSGSFVTVAEFKMLYKGFHNYEKGLID